MFTKQIECKIDHLCRFCMFNFWQTGCVYMDLKILEENQWRNWKLYNKNLSYYNITLKARKPTLECTNLTLESVCAEKMPTSSGMDRFGNYMKIATKTSFWPKITFYWTVEWIAAEHLCVYLWSKYDAKYIANLQTGPVLYHQNGIFHPKFGLRQLARSSFSAARINLGLRLCAL